MVRTRPLQSPGLIELVLYLAFGAAAGVLAAGLLQVFTPIRAMLYIVGLGAGLGCLISPQFGLYLLTGAMIAVWPGQLIKILGAAVCLLVVLWALAQRRRLLTFDSILVVQLLLTALISFSAIRLGYLDSMKIALSFASYLMLTWVFSTASVSPKVVQRLAATMLVSGVIVALIGMVQYVRPFVWIVSATQIDASSPYYSGSSQTDSLMLDGTLRIESITGTPNFLGLTMQMLLPFAVLWTVRQTSYRAWAIGLAMIALLAAAMVLTFTRGVLLTSAIVTVPLLAIKLGLRRTLPYLAAGAVLALLVVVLWAPLRERMLSVVSELLSTSMGTEAAWSTAAGWRASILPVVWDMFRDHFWLGVGIGEHRDMWRVYAPTYVVMPGTEAQLPIHNVYLQLAVDLGIGGITLFVLLVVVAWVGLRRAEHYFQAHQQQGMLDLANAAEIAWITTAVSNTMYPGLDDFRYFWVLLALVAAIKRVAADQRFSQRGGAYA